MKNLNAGPKYVAILLISGLILILVACSMDNTFLVTKTVQVTSTKTVMPFSPSKTPTSVPIRTETPDMALTPTVSAEQVEAHLQELLMTNANCSLPCWWGVIPGLTKTNETRFIFEPFLGAVVNENGYEILEEGQYYMRPLSNGFQVGIEVFAKDNVVSLIYIQTKMTKDIYTRVYNDPLYQETMSAYSLKAILDKYGKPDRILVRSFSQLAGEINPTQILLYYPDEGIVVQYFSENQPEQKNEIIINQTCPPKSHISLRLFNLDSPLSLQDILAIDDSYAKYKEISEVTNMDADTFFQIYRQYDEKALQSNCPAYLETPWEIWPAEYRNP